MGSANLPPNDEEIEETLDVIRNELECNGIRLYGDYDEIMIKTANIAFEKGFNTVIITPRYMKINENESENIEGFTEKFISFSKKVEELRSIYPSVILSIGTELTIDVKGIYDGTTYSDRQKQISTNWGKSEYQERLNSYLKRVIKNTRKNFNGKITYDRGSWEQVEWDKSDFDIVGSNQYYGTQWDTEQSYEKRIYDLKKNW